MLNDDLLRHLASYTPSIAASLYGHVPGIKVYPECVLYCVEQRRQELAIIIFKQSVFKSKDRRTLFLIIHRAMDRFMIHLLETMFDSPVHIPYSMFFAQLLYNYMPEITLKYIIQLTQREREMFYIDCIMVIHN